MATLAIPDVLQPYTNVSQLDVPIETLDQLPAWLRSHFPKLYHVLFLNNHLNGFVNLYLNEHPVTAQVSNPMHIPENATLKLVTSISGG